MRYITIPSAVDLKDPMTNESSGRVYPFKEFISQMLLDMKWGRTSGDIFAAADIRQKFMEAGFEPGSVVELEDSAWERLSGVLKEPSSPYAPVLVIQVTDFLRAVLDAPSKKPS